MERKRELQKETAKRPRKRSKRKTKRKKDRKAGEAERKTVQLEKKEAPAMEIRGRRVETKMAKRKKLSRKTGTKREGFEKRRSKESLSGFRE